MELGWIIWNTLFALLILGLGARMVAKSKLLREGSWWIGFALLILSVWTLFYIFSITTGNDLLNSNAPLQFTDVSEGIGRFFLNIINFFIGN